MSLERMTDIPGSELKKVIDDYEFWDYEIVNKIDQGDGFWTIEVRKKAAAGPGSTVPGAGSVSTPAASPTVGAGTSAGGSSIGVASPHLDGAAILAVARRHVGQKYGPQPPNYADPEYKGEFDCAEFASYCAYHTYGILFGTRPKGRVAHIESYTGYWKEDALSHNATITWQEALRTAGAFVLRYPPGSGEMGHIGICTGDGNGIYEAHSTNRGVILGLAGGRRWDVGVRLPGVRYGAVPFPSTDPLVYRLFDPPRAYDSVVEKLQVALQKQGYLGAQEITGIYDRAMYDAVVRYQQALGLVVDGEVGRDTGSRLLGEAGWKEIRTQAGSAVGPETPEHDLLTLARTIYGEARGETPKGQEAVANVVLNRASSPRFPDTIMSVCLQPYQFSCWNVNDPNYPKIRELKPGDNADIDKCYLAARRVVRGEVSDHTGGAMHYHSTNIPKPKWVTDSPKARVTATIGTHVFYVGIR